MNNLLPYPMHDHARGEAARSYSCDTATIPAGVVVARDTSELSKRFSHVGALGVRAVRVDDTLADLAGVTVEEVLQPTDPTQPAAFGLLPSTLTRAGHAWIRCSGEITPGERGMQSLPTFGYGFDRAVVGDVVGLVLEGEEAGYVRRFEKNDIPIGGVLVVDGGFALVRLELEA